MPLLTHHLVDDHQPLSETTGTVKLVNFLFIACDFCILLGNVALAKCATSPIAVAVVLLHKKHDNAAGGNATVLNCKRRVVWQQDSWGQTTERGCSFCLSHLLPHHGASLLSVFI